MDRIVSIASNFIDAEKIDEDTLMTQKTVNMLPIKQRSK